MSDSREVPVSRFIHIVEEQLGIYRSICRVCYQTVAETSRESKLIQVEEEHHAQDRRRFIRRIWDSAALSHGPEETSYPFFRKTLRIPCNIEASPIFAVFVRGKMDSLRLPYFVRSKSDIHEISESLEALQNLMELIREDIQHPLRIKSHVDQANKLLRTVRSNL